MKMFIRSVKLNNIRSYLDETIEFPEGSVLLSGDIGSGKSTILLAIEFALFGVQRGDVSGSELLRHGKASGSVTLTFLINGRDYTIKRSLKRGRAISQDACELYAGGVRNDYTPTELKAKILEMLGYPRDAMNRNIPIFRFTVYTPQEQMKHIMTSAEDRLNALRKIFNTDRYGRIRQNSKIFLSELRSMKRELDAFARDMEEVEKRREEAHEKRKQVAMSITHEVKMIKDVDRRIEEKNAQFTEARKKLQDANRAKQVLIGKESALGNERYKLERALKEKARDEERLASSRKDFESYTGLEKPRYSAAEIQKMILSLEKEKSGLVMEKITIESETRSLRQVYEKGICSVCGQSVSDPESFRGNIDAKSVHAASLHKAAEEKAAEIEGLRKEKEDVLRYEYELRNYEKLAGEIHGLEADIENHENDIADLKASIAAMEKELALLKPKLQDTAQLEKDFSQLEDDIRKLGSEKLNYEKARSRLEQELNDTERSIADMERSIGEKKKAREKIASINELAAWLDEHFAGLMELIEKHVMLTIQKEFNSLFQEWFSIIMPDENLQVSIDENFAPVMMQNGFETSYQNLSGGEQTSVALAYRLALNKVINVLIETIKTKDILILDEPTDGLSSEQIDRIRDVLGELQLRQIIIVSHEPKIDTFVDNVIRLYKEDHVSRIEKA